MKKVPLHPVQIAFLLAFIFFAASGVALAKVTVTDVSLKANVLNPEVVSAEIFGETSNSCSELGIYFSLGEADRYSKELSLHLDSKPDFVGPRVCAERVLPFAREVSLGMLEPGYYTIQVYQEGLATFRKGFSIPFDVRSLPLGVDIYKFLGNSDFQTDQTNKKS